MIITWKKEKKNNSKWVLHQHYTIYVTGKEDDSDKIIVFHYHNSDNNKDFLVRQIAETF